MYWKEVNAATGQEVFVDFCRMSGSECDSEGNLVTLYMRGARAIYKVSSVLDACNS